MLAAGGWLYSVVHMAMSVDCSLQGSKPMRKNGTAREDRKWLRDCVLSLKEFTPSVISEQLHSLFSAWAVRVCITHGRNRRLG